MYSDLNGKYCIVLVVVWILDGNSINFLCACYLKEMRGAAGEKSLFEFSTFFLKLKNRWIGLTATSFERAILNKIIISLRMNRKRKIGVGISKDFQGCCFPESVSETETS